MPCTNLVSASSLPDPPRGAQHLPAQRRGPLHPAGPAAGTWGEKGLSGPPRAGLGLYTEGIGGIGFRRTEAVQGLQYLMSCHEERCCWVTNGGSEPSSGSRTAGDGGRARPW